MCQNIQTFGEDEILELAYQPVLDEKPRIPNITMISIELYCDGNYPRGLSVLYQIEGKTKQLNFIEKC